MKKLFSLLVFGAFALSGCSTPDETTAIGAASGGALGAGLGAIVGSTHGNAGAGLVVGGIAGGATGAAIGNVFQGQEEALRSQDEAIERQQQQIASQRREINELRKLGQDNVSFRSDLHGALRTNEVSHGAGVRIYEPETREQQAKLPIHGSAPFPGRASSDRAALSQSTVSSAHAEHGAYDWGKGNSQNKAGSEIAHIGERDLGINQVPSARIVTKEDRIPSFRVDQSEVKVEVTKPSLNSSTTENQKIRELIVEQEAVPQDPPLGEEFTEIARNIQGDLSSSECLQAGREVEQSESSDQVSDKLFHMRRALRLCPKNPQYHIGLGKIYTSLNRQIDAQFEFEQALTLDPSLEEAKRELSSLKNG